MKRDATQWPLASWGYMKLVVFTPALKASAIGRSAALVTKALVEQGHHVIVVRSEAPEFLDRESHNFHTVLIPWAHGMKVEDAVRWADTIVYHIGDNYAYHIGSIEWIRRWPGIVCLHDFYLGHLFFGWAQGRKNAAYDVLTKLYGAEIAKSFMAYNDGYKLLKAMHDKAPLTEWIAGQAAGVIAHSSWGIKRVKAACRGPVVTAGLPYDAPALPSATQTNKRFEVLTIGHANPNKRCETIIRAIGANPFLKANTTYRMVGAIEPGMQNYLRHVAWELKVDLECNGPVNDNDLMKAIARADVVTCLRWPSLESASASAIEAMLYGKAIIVTNTGFYREIPDKCALKVDPDNEFRDVLFGLNRLRTDATLRESMGQAAQEWARETFSADKYATAIVDMAGPLKLSA